MPFDITKVTVLQKLIRILRYLSKTSLMQICCNEITVLFTYLMYIIYFILLFTNKINPVTHLF